MSQGRCLPCPHLWVVARCSSLGSVQTERFLERGKGIRAASGCDGVGGSGTGRAGERGSFSSIPPPPNLCPPATGTSHVCWVLEGQRCRGGGRG